MRGHLLRVSHATSLAVAGAASGRERATHPILAYLSAVTNMHLAALLTSLINSNNLSIEFSDFLHTLSGCPES